jgi:hypothetical protein
MHGPAITRPVRERHIRGSWTSDKKLRAAIAGTLSSLARDGGRFE